jgi:hypothetical protein
VVGGRVDVELEAMTTDWGPATCIRMTASYRSIRVAGPSFRKSTDAYARSRAP